MLIRFFKLLILSSLPIFVFGQKIENLLIEVEDYVGICPARLPVTVTLISEDFANEPLHYHFETSEGVIDEKGVVYTPAMGKTTRPATRTIASNETAFTAFLYLNQSAQDLHVSIHINQPEVITVVSNPVSVECTNAPNNTSKPLIDLALQQECGNALLLIGRARPCQDIQIDAFPDFIEHNADKTEFLYPVTFYLNPIANPSNQTITVEVYLDHLSDLWATFEVDLSENLTSFTQNISLPVGQHTLIVNLDTDNQIAEVNELNTFRRNYHLENPQLLPQLDIERVCISLHPPEETASALQACKPITDTFELYLPEAQQALESVPYVLLFGLYASADRDKFPKSTFEITYAIDGEVQQSIEGVFPNIGIPPKLRLDRVMLTLPTGEHQIQIVIVENNELFFKESSQKIYTFKYILH